MAGSQVSVVATQVEKQRLGYQAISLTNFGNTSEPQIAAGSKVEIGSSLFEFTALESITGWSGIAVSSDVYIKLTVSGSSVTASFTTTAPTWDTAKQGWYSGSDRYIGGLYKDASGNYAIKWLYPADPGDPINQEMLANSQTRPLLRKDFQMGDWNMDTGAAINIAHGMTMGKIRAVTAFVRNDTDSEYYAISDISRGTIRWGPTNISLGREVGGLFDSTDFNSTSYNRGYITVVYRA